MLRSRRCACFARTVSSQSLGPPMPSCGAALYSKMLPMNRWDREYKRAGIPSSFRDDPSGVLVWTLDVWPHVAASARPTAALDVGCGTGRNSIHLGLQGARVVGF